MLLDLLGKSVLMRPVTPEDAADLIRLRTDPRCCGCLAPTSSDLVAQQEWLEAYKERERQGKEIYSAICSRKDQHILGAFRILNLTEKDFGLGSWVIERGAEPQVAVESILLMYDAMFLRHGFASTHFEVQRGNSSLLRFHPKLGAQVIGEDERELRFRNTVEAYQNARPRYQRYLPLSA